MKLNILAVAQSDTFCFVTVMNGTVDILRELCPPDLRYNYRDYWLVETRATISSSPFINATYSFERKVNK